MSNTPPIPDNARSASNDDPAANLDRIRDIVFGAQMRDYERRFAQLEQRLQQEVTRLMGQLEQRCNQLDQLVSTQVERLSIAVAGEQSERRGALAEVGSRLGSLGKELRADAADLDGRMKSALNTLQQDLRDDLHQQGKQLSERLDTVGEELGGDKTGREELAALLDGLVQQLRNSARK